jgi:hypothetical protein
MSLSPQVVEFLLDLFVRHGAYPHPQEVVGLRVVAEFCVNEVVDVSMPTLDVSRHFVVLVCAEPVADRLAGSPERDDPGPQLIGPNEITVERNELVHRQRTIAATSRAAAVSTAAIAVQRGVASWNVSTMCPMILAAAMSTTRLGSDWAKGLEELLHRYGEAQARCDVWRSVCGSNHPASV